MDFDAATKYDQTLPYNRFFSNKNSRIKCFFFVKELSTILSKIPYLGGKKYIWPMKFVKENFDMLKGLYTV